MGRIVAYQHREIHPDKIYHFLLLSLSGLLPLGTKIDHR